MNLLMSLMFMMSFTLLMLNHPLSMGLILIIQTMITAVIIGYMMKSFFFSYIIIIIMLSGALVLFIYMASVASNEKFKFSLSVLIGSVVLFMLINFIMFYYNHQYLYDMIDSNSPINLIKIYNMMTAQLTMLMIIYLLFTMIIVSNNAKITEGPLRMKN
uniref:NADH dehydrogenase subunit 6 n=1 Tax=Cazira horvathi TaxID=2575653 RepID=A0A4D6X5I4_9HEMI|nr:NADH dehydrogenase subunit 6 [Cazira horvathi]QCI09888.1 NADH dehydrogenase subunit 6 [Cazira horvathi]